MYDLEDCRFSYLEGCWGNVKSRGWDAQFEDSVWEDYEVIACEAHRDFYNDGSFNGPVFAKPE